MNQATTEQPSQQASTPAGAGRVGEAREILAGLEAQARERYVSPVPFVVLHLGLTDAEGAFAAIAREHAERRGWMAYLRVDPMLDPLRGDPRFGEWLGNMRL